MSRARDLADLGGSADVGTITGDNIIINGDMTVSQRGTSETGVTTGGYKQAPDRHIVLMSGMGTWTMSQSTDAPSGFSNSYKWDCTTADASPAAGDYIILAQRIEGQNLQHLKKGTADAKSVTASFWVKSAKTGTYILELYDNDNTRSISKSYTISSADTWEYKKITFEGDTTGTLDNDNSQSFVLGWWLGAGSTFTSGTLATSWESNTQANRAVGVVNLADSTSNDWYITGVKLEVGSTATPFKHETYAENLRKCHRYFRKSEHVSGAGYQSFGSASAFGTTVASGSLYYGHMRTNPTLAQSGGNLYGAGGNHAISALSTSYFGTERAFVNITSSGLTSGYGYNWCGNNNTGAYVTMDAEL